MSTNQISIASLRSPQPVYLETSVSHRSPLVRIEHLTPETLRPSERTVKVRHSQPWISIAFEPLHCSEAVDSNPCRPLFFANRAHFCPSGVSLSHTIHGGRRPESLELFMDEAFTRSTLEDLAPDRGPQDRILVRNAPPGLLALAKVLRGHLLKGDQMSAVQMESFAVLCLSEWAQDLDNRKGARPGHRLSEPQLKDIEHFMHENLDREIRLADLSALVGLSTAHFLRAFKAATGQTPFRYLMERRVQNAASLLRESRHSLAEISLVCGFASQSHMSDAFKRHMNITPGRYRKQHCPKHNVKSR